MELLVHSIFFLLALAVVWLLSGLVIEATNRVALRYNKPGFAVAFFVLGFLTSIGESSVALNATIEKVPQVSAGNLVGASIVIFFLIIPLLALISGRIELNDAIRPRNMALALLIVLLPSLFAVDGIVTPQEALMIILLYVTLIFLLRKKKPLEKTAAAALERVEKELTHTWGATARDISYIIVGAIIIFLAGNVLVTESIFLTGRMGIPSSFAGLLILSIGTNIPELIVGVRAVMSRKVDIAFGDYLGSSTANSVIFAFMTVANGRFLVDTKEFSASFLFTLVGLITFFLFARTKAEVSRTEGAILLVGYLGFLAYQIGLVLG